MAVRQKRTYNLSPTAIDHVRRIAERSASYRSQDAVVEAAIERLHEQILLDEEAALWGRASEDPEFRAETAAIAEQYDTRQKWPA